MKGCKLWVRSNRPERGQVAASASRGVLGIWAIQENVNRLGPTGGGQL